MKLKSHLRNPVKVGSLKESRAAHQGSLNPKGMLSQSREGVKKWFGSWNPEGITEQSPGLAFSSQPWVAKESLRNPERVASPYISAGGSIAATPSGLKMTSAITQGWLDNANPGLCYGIPLGFKSPSPVRALQAALTFAILLVLLFTCGRGIAQEKPSIPEIDRIRIAEAFRLGDQVSDHVWPGWTKAPFALLLVTPDYEFLLRHPAPSADFQKLGYDALLKSDVFYRKRFFSVRLLATFPAINGSGISTIVVGQAENTEAKTSTPWVISLLHEHFHQLQDSQTGFYQDTTALNLAHGDQTGMWMLNYAFPYDRKEVQDEYASLSKLLVEAVQAAKSDQTAKLQAYLQERRKFQQMLAPDDYKYISFEIWKEGIARYTEYQVAQAAAEKYRASKEFLALKDYTPLAAVAKEIHERCLRQLLTQDLAKSRREVVYPFGAAEGFLLNKINPGWQSRYFKQKFDLGSYYPWDIADFRLPIADWP